ncbi:hypothetical protein [Roseovarius sp.]|uniref:hypothetical protein n=1 Tax=Roseovarius sp. TaxID=1486281 RepID=UPI00356805A5
MTWDLIGRASGRNTDAVRKAVNAALKTGKSPAKSMVKALTQALPAIHDEVPLHSYGPTLLSEAVILREQEETLREAFRACDDANGVRKVWGQAQDVLCDTLSTIALDVICDWSDRYWQDADKLTEDTRTAIYIAAQRLHGLVVVWSDAADAMLGKPDDGEGRVLVLAQPLANGETIIDVALVALALYETIEADLKAQQQEAEKTLHWMMASVELLPTEERHNPVHLRNALKRMPEIGAAPGRTQLEAVEEQEDVLDLLRQDHAIAALNMMGLISHLRDWCEASTRLAPIIGMPAERLVQQTAGARAQDTQVVKLAQPLLQRHPQHRLIARNLAYHGLQCGEPEVVRAARDHLAGLLGVEPDAVWTISIVGRTPLTKDIPQAFDNGLPRILTEKETA